MKKTTICAATLAAILSATAAWAGSKAALGGRSSRPSNRRA
jgi:hypothetical protein